MKLGFLLPYLGCSIAGQGKRQSCALVSQSGGVGAMHHRFPGVSRPMPTSQYLLSAEIRKLLAILAVTLLPEGSSSTRTRIPGLRERGKRTPQPLGFTRSVWHRSEKRVAGSRLVTRKGICAFSLVPRRLWTSSGISVRTILWEHPLGDLVKA